MYPLEIEADFGDGEYKEENEDYGLDESEDEECLQDVGLRGCPASIVDSEGHRHVE